MIWRAPVGAQNRGQYNCTLYTFSRRSDYSCKLDLSDNKHCGKVYFLTFHLLQNIILSCLWWHQYCVKYLPWIRIFPRALASGSLLSILYQTVALRGSGHLPTQSSRWDLFYFIELISLPCRSGQMWRRKVSAVPGWIFFKAKLLLFFFLLCSGTRLFSCNKLAIAWRKHYRHFWKVSVYLSCSIFLQPCSSI